MVFNSEFFSSILQCWSFFHNENLCYLSKRYWSFFFCMELNLNKILANHSVTTQWPPNYHRVNQFPAHFVETVSKLGALRAGSNPRDYTKQFPVNCVTTRRKSRLCCNTNQCFFCQVFSQNPRLLPSNHQVKQFPAYLVKTVSKLGIGAQRAGSTK